MSSLNANATAFVPTEAPSPAPVPAEAHSPAPAPVHPHDVTGAREWDDWVSDPTTSKPFTVNGISFYIKNSPPRCSAIPIATKMKDHGQCNACTERARKFAFLVGEDGPAFMNNIRHVNDGWHSVSQGSLSCIRKMVVKVNKAITDPKVFIVKDGSFPGINEGLDFGDTMEKTLTPNSPGTGLKVDGKVLPFQHVTIRPDSYTVSDLVDKYEKVIMEYVPIIGPRLEKLCIPEAIDSVNIIEANLHKLERPGHWASVMRWVKDVQKTWSDGNYHSYESMTSIDKVRLAVAAITSPESKIEHDGDTVVHKSYKQASNVVDFLTLGPIEDVLKEMDIRSDPNNYMISQLSRRMTKEKITSKYTISLVWDGKFKDDLDIHVKFGGPTFLHEIFYGRKVINFNGTDCRLDFDANVSHGESEPCENVSVCSGTFQVWVNNYTRRTRGDVPFTIILHQEGIPDTVIERTWTSDRRKDDKLLITTHTFTDINSKAPEMTMKEAARARALNSKWEEHFGTPVSYVPNVEELTIPVNIWEKSDDIAPSTNANISFMAMASNTVQKKKYLSQIESDKKPDTLSKLLTLMSTGKHTLEIEPRNFSPSYITEIKTNKVVLKNPYSLNHYNEKFKLPGKPQEGHGNARFTPDWFLLTSNLNKAKVDCFIQFGTTWFMVINDTRLPNTSDFPLGGGFHPTKLTAGVHDLRDRWAFCNTQIKPLVKSNGTPTIGSVLTTDKIDVILNGNKLTVSVE